MKQRDIRAYLSDISSACDRITRFTSARTVEDFREDDLLRYAVERCFEIIGEALAHATRIEPSLLSRVSSAARIIGLRNRLIHGYHTVDPDVVWGIIEGYVPTLAHEARDLLADRL